MTKVILIYEEKNKEYKVADCCVVKEHDHSDVGWIHTFTDYDSMITEIREMWFDNIHDITVNMDKGNTKIITSVAKIYF